MDWTPYHILIALLLVTTGTLNTLTTKWADRISAKSSDDVERKFNHPFVQSLVMFIGEMSCLFAFKLLQLRRPTTYQPLAESTFSPMIFFIPAMCDMVATSIMYVGLTLTFASSFQMLRGSLVVFVALLSLGFLDRKINAREWIGIGFVITGLSVIGVSDFLTEKGTGRSSMNAIVTGDLLIVMAQIVTAVQMVVEERLMVANRNVAPLQVVGWEGVFGFSVLTVLLVPFYYIHVGVPFSGNPRGVLEDVPDAFVQISNNPLLLAPILGTVLSISFFNFAGISVTKHLSATTRTILDSVRTLVIWIVTVALGWQPFSSIQILGFVLLLLGIFIYNDIYVTCIVRNIAAVYQRQGSSQRISSNNIVNQQADEPSA